jgi:hypothetical protein
MALNLYNFLSENPKELMRDHVRNLMESRSFELNYPCLFDSSNIKSLFGILDPGGSGYITSNQFKSGEHYVYRDRSQVSNTLYELSSSQLMVALD